MDQLHEALKEYKLEMMELEEENEEEIDVEDNNEADY